MKAIEPLVRHLMVEGLQLKDDHHLLDLGTGTGRLGLQVHDKLPKGVVVGIDSDFLVNG